MKAAATAIAAAAPAVRSAADAARVHAPGAVAPAKAGAHAEQIFAWLGEVPDPEIPVISIVDLGIVRDVRVADDGACDVTITPTYSGCPAMQVIADAIIEALHARGVATVRLHNQLSPAWTTDWMSDAGKAALRGYGIAPPAQQVIDISGLRAGRTALAAVSRRAVIAPSVACPHCGATHTEITSQFGSTPCKALYKCLACREPFDYFKCH
ncbi:phenylacetate-CoA oxygenase subunit PaaJ [Pseudoduganella sp. FT55W]|uniref:Phenylacetate-CoA oxygenase subunit PaaJ n=1 Tax=Duganella rivi TaxID=2666083 RepID=A0A7X4KD87_9BURK|nr:1,2-phenylacetyl-CoA epoxidase subunit PaaD [Duganella rivi]MYM70041.1 phenylacetate-CoA oxygenase subunit PaaJ [Duganella rivi]